MVAAGCPVLVKYDATYVVPAVTATGEEKSSSCHPRGLAGERPGRQQRPRRGPQAPGMRAGVIGLLVEPHPGDKPAAGGL